MDTNISQWLGFGFVVAIGALIPLYFFLLSLKLLRSVLHHSPDLLLPDRPPVTPTTLHFQLTLALTSFVITTTLFFVFLLTATNDTLSSWRLNYVPRSLIIQYILILSFTAGIVNKREFPEGRSHLSEGLSLGIYLGTINMMSVYFLIALILDGKATLPDEILCIGTLPIIVILIGFGIKGRHGSKETDELGDQGVVDEEV